MTQKDIRDIEIFLGNLFGLLNRISENTIDKGTATLIDSRSLWFLSRQRTNLLKEFDKIMNNKQRYDEIFDKGTLDDLNELFYSLDNLTDILEGNPYSRSEIDDLRMKIMNAIKSINSIRNRG